MGRIVLNLREFFITGLLIARQSAVSLRYNWGIALLALVLATSLWVYITDREDEEQTVRVPGTVPVEAVNVPPDQAVFPPLEESVSVRVRGPASIVEDLRADDFRATVDLSDVQSQQAVVRVEVEPPDGRVSVVDITPAQVAVRLQDLTSREVPVRAGLVGAPPRGFEAGEPAVEPQDAIVTGPESVVALVESVNADVNLTGVRTNFEERVLLEARDASGRDIDGVQIIPESALVRVELTQLDFSAGFVVRPDIDGTPAPGYNATAIQVEPAIVVISGPSEVFATLDPVDGLSTQPVSIEGASADVIRTVALQLPEGATAATPTVTVRVTIEPAQGAFRFVVPIQATNTPAGLTAALDPANVEVVLSGTVPDLRAVSADQISATVNLSGLDVGEHDVAVQVSAPSGLRVTSVSPAQVRVTLQPAP